jgi:hypothetical protein
MAINQFKLKRSAVSGRIPTTSSLSLGELAMNTYDGKLYFKQDRSGSESIVELAPSTGFIPSQIAIGNITASVSTNPNELFLIKSGSSTYFNISSSSAATLYSDLFVIKNFTTQQPVLTVSESIVQFATHSSAPSGDITVGSIWFTSSSLYIGLE